MTDMERLIEAIVDDISCHGDLGCPVSRILDKIDQFYSSDRSFPVSSNTSAVSPRQAAWDWIRARCDVSVGNDRRWNHATLSDVLAMPEEPGPADGLRPTPAPSGRPASEMQEDNAIREPSNPTAETVAGVEYRPKVFVSEEQMWQSIAGHGADFKRVPKLEWAALVGIASTKKDGILQGDLCRLIRQDKRSLPKRTDSLAQKGYILKRTTLVRGVKTSKMWLSRCAPSLSSDHTETRFGGHGQDTALLMPPEKFNRDMEPVAWRSRWTGGSIDMLSLAETVISIVRAFGIMRYHDLRQKLGILTLPWQMKVTARLCRWAVRRGILQYVGATLGDRLYKDCLKFIRDFTSDDWVEWLRTGKEKARPKTDADLDAYRHNPNGDSSLKRKRNKKPDDSIDIMVAWKPEKPLATTVLDAIRAADGKAVTNRHLGAHTLGPPFSRYVTSISTTLATPSLQPEHLAHFQVSKELMRVKKQAIYFFSLPRMRAAANHHDLPSKHALEDTPLEDHSLFKVAHWSSNSFDNYFSSTASRAVRRKSASLSSLARMTGRRDSAALTRAANQNIPVAVETGNRSRAGSILPADGLGSSPVVLNVDQARSLPRVIRQPPPNARGHRGRRTTTLIVTIFVEPNSLALILQQSESGSSSEDNRRGTAQTNRPIQIYSRSAEHLPPVATILDCPATGAQGGNDPAGDGGMADVPGTSQPGQSEPAPVKRGRQKRAAVSKKSRSAKAGTFRCDKCGGVWQNDNGLKYHLEKSSSPCNTSYSAPPPRPPRYLSARTSLPSGTGISDRNKGEGVPTRRTRKGMTAALDNSPGVRTPRGHKQVARASSAFQHAPALRARSQRQDFDPDESIGLHLPVRAGSSPATAKDPAPTHFHALLRDTNATLLDAFREEADEVAESHTSAHQYAGTDPRTKVCNGHHDTPRELVPYTKTTATYENATLVSQTPCQLGMAGSITDSEPCIGVAAKDAGVSRADLASQAVPFQMPPKSDTSKSSSQRHNSQFHRSSEIIQHLLVVHGGVIPGDRSLWHALTAVWEKTFPNDSPPNYGTTQGLVSKMVGRKVLRKSVHAFRDSKGSFKSVTLLLAPGIDSQSSAILELKDKMIATHPQTYVLPGYIPASGLPDDMKWNGIPVFSTRRQLAQNVEVLNAPFYASRQASRKRPRPSDTSGRSPRRRQQSSAGGVRNQSVISEDEVSVSELHKVFVGGHGAESRQQHRGQHAVGPLTFLKPNTFLQDDIALSAMHKPRGFLLSTKRSRRSSRAEDSNLVDYGREECEPYAVKQHRIRMVEPLVFGKTRHGWPCLNTEFFEGNQSVTMQGQLIPTSRAFTHLLPGGLIDIVGPHWLVPHETTSEASYHSFLQQVELCAAWETDIQRGAQLARMQSIAPNYIWINHTLNVPSGHTATYRKFAWIRESPGPLPGSGAHRPVPECVGARDVAFESSPYAKRRKLNDGPSRSTAAVLPMDLKTRKMTPWNGTNEDSYPALECRRLDENNDAVLIAAFVATRTLLGGADKYVEWGLLLRLFPKKSLAWLRKFWSKARKDRAASINKLTKRFQERFVKAYDEGELPLIDFDDYLSYDWPRLVEWTLDLAGDAIRLPASMAELERQYVMDTLTADTSDWQRIYYSFQSSTFNRLEALTASSTCAPIDEFVPEPLPSSIEELRKAKSWLRALCGTKSGTYKPAVIRDKLCHITEHGDIHNNSLLGRAIVALQNQNVITKTKQRSGDSGSHRFTEWFMPRFDKISQAHKFNDAVSFKAMIDGIFKEGKPWRVPYLLQDGEVMAMINMQAAGRIKVTPVDVPHIPLGFKPGFYESRKFPKSFYNFGLEVTPTDIYVFNEELAVLGAAHADTPPKEDPAGKLPIWSDIFGKLAADRWGRTVRAVAFVIAMRGPLSIDGILAALTPFLEDFEIELVVDWGLRNQLFKQTVHGRTYTADEWWWLLAGSQYHEQLAGAWTVTHQDHLGMQETP